jgi:RimJ/RimL family protein N-acetyltransferase
MKPLPAADFAKVVPLIEQAEIRSHLALAHTLLEGRQEGQIFVDDCDRPRTALVWPRNGFCFLFGEVEADGFERFLPELLARHLVDKCAVYATSAAWRERLDRLFTQRVSRSGFEFHALPASQPEASEPMPLGIALQRMTPSVLAKWGRGLDPWVIEIWGGPERLAAEAPGFCLLAGDRIISFATACAIGGGEAEVEVGTAPEFRGQGLAERVCRAFIEECLARGLRPAWSSSTGNTPSEALARKLGFVKTEEVHGYPLEATLRCEDGVWRSA